MKSLLFSRLLLCIAASTFFVTAPAAKAMAVAESDGFAAVRAPHALNADPSLDDAAWQRGRVAKTDQFVDVTTRRPAGDVTNAYILYDDTALYVAFVCSQKEPIVANQAANDVGFGLDDFVGIGVDTSGNGSQSYYFETTPRGVRYQQAS
ncbi:MAG TPA: hypothetical protein VFA29_06355, partial [Candidatus Baltobacteraceae bacterium]|nr:hypothetical protein [Candidatus Baltobacteraceae bacterium]